MAFKKIIAVTMIGMNRGSAGDSAHPFSIEQFTSKYTTHWLPQVSKREQQGSTLFYEHMKAVDNLCTKQSIDPKNVHFICGRGTIGNRSEQNLATTLQESVNVLGKDAFKVIVAKSFGVVDSLRMFKFLGREGQKNVGKIDLMFCIDGYGPFFSRRSVSKKMKIAGKGETRFVIPGCVNKVFTIVQRYKRFKGLKSGREGDKRITNYVVKQPYVDSLNMVYDHYSDGYIRPLEITHFNMDEIATVVPWCINKNKAHETIADSINNHFSTTT